MTEKPLSDNELETVSGGLGENVPHKYKQGDTFSGNYNNVSVKLTVLQFIGLSGTAPSYSVEIRNAATRMVIATGLRMKEQQIDDIRSGGTRNL